ncbi:hypothetical protein [Nonomuraea sp. NPDC048901]|uniref:hypothetical protein n=1 Tax=Nonomuraea sp. NPDC048901 TaxID=3155627 RepID=UPI0034066CEC
MVPGDEVALAGLTVRFKEWLSTTTNTLMFRAETRSGTEVTVKTTEASAGRDLVGNGSEQLAAQAGQLRATERILGAASPFPRFVSFDGDTLIQEYARGGVLTRAALADRHAPALELAFDTLLRLSQLSYEHRTAATLRDLDFLTTRLSRLADILRHICGAELSQHIRENASLSCAIDTAISWQHDPPIDLGRTLTLCAHGDFVPQNIVAAPGGGEITFIDPRGYVLWEDGVPWWDPVIELASFTLFHEIVPRLSAAADHMTSGEPWASVQPFHDSATRLGIDVGRAWPNLEQELDYFISARIIGFVAVSAFYQASSAFPDATVLADLLPLSVRRVESPIA